MGRRQGARRAHPAPLSILLVFFSLGRHLKVVRDVTDEQRGRRPIFNATLWAAASWLFFRVARSLRIALDMLVARALKNSQLTCGDITIICETAHWKNEYQRKCLGLCAARTDFKVLTHPQNRRHW
jgi:hypothetical protein